MNEANQVPAKDAIPAFTMEELKVLRQLLLTKKMYVDPKTAELFVNSGLAKPYGDKEGGIEFIPTDLEYEFIFLTEDLLNQRQEAAAMEDIKKQRLGLERNQ